MPDKTESKKSILAALSDCSHPHYLMKDTELSQKYNLGRTTLRLLREENGIGGHRDRVLGELKKLSTGGMYLADVVAALDGRVEYMCLYKIFREEGLPLLKKGKND